MAVIFGEDALSGETLARIFSYIEKAKAEFVWSANFHVWSPTLVASAGAVLTHILPEQIAEALFSEIRERGKIPYRPRSNVMMFYSWLPGSSITWHRDYPDKNSLSVYLNKEWKADDGGCFCWKDWDETMNKDSHDTPPDISSMRVPRYNNYVYMTDAEWHAVTITAPGAPARLSLQAFFDKP